MATSILRQQGFKFYFMSKKKFIHKYICYRLKTSATHERYPYLKRSDFSKLSETDINHFRTFLETNQIISDSFDLEPHNTDWLHNYRGISELMLKPRTTEQVSNILKYCSKRNLAVCPQGGNTGLVGGSVPVFDEIILNTSLMNNIINFDDLSGVLVCQAGCILEHLEEFVSEKSCTMPLDLGAKGSCQIGGNVATNAGGLRLVRYGSLHGNVLGLEVVLPSGEILDCMSTLRKDNTGYDIKQLFIGSEGTLGVITKISILCPPKPNAVAVILLGCESFDRLLETYRAARQLLGEVISSVEFMDHECIKLCERNLKLKQPLATMHPFYMLIEVAGSNMQHNVEKLENFLEHVTTKGIIKDGIMASETRQIREVWALRERITESLKIEGVVYKYDISVPIQNFPSIVDSTRNQLGSLVTVCCGFGHIADGNLHFNAVAKTFDPKILSSIELHLYGEVIKYKGSISAEHGIGFLKRKEMPKIKNDVTLNTMYQLKKLLDPQNILNPYKTLP